MKKQLNTLLISSCIIFCGQAQAGLVKNGVWQIEQGDSLKSILKAALPEEPLRQKRLKRLSPLLNKKAFDAKGELVVGQNLRLPGVRMPSTDSVTNTDSAEQIGRILITNGPTQAQAADGKQRTLKRGSAINKGDTIQTQGARAQLRFSDGSLVALRPNTEFKVEEYNYNGAQDGSEKSIYNLIKGGFRTISGAIGKINKSNYQVRTAVATIGIRGTHYGVTLCTAGSCAEQGLADGLYGGVVDGSIVASNEGGKSIFNNDEYFLITGPGGLAKQLLAPPGVIFDDPSVANQQATSETKEPADALQAANRPGHPEPDFDGTTDGEQIRELVKEIRVHISELPSELTHPVLPGTRDPGAIAAFSFVGVNPNPLQPNGPVTSVADSIQDDGSITNINTESGALKGLSYETDLGGNVTAIASVIGEGTSNLTDVNSNASLGLIWGRWSDTPIKVAVTDDVSVSSTPQTGIMYAIASQAKALTSAYDLETFVDGNSIGQGGPSTETMLNPAGGVEGYDLAGNQALEVDSQLTIDFTTQELKFSVENPIQALQGEDTYILHTGTDHATANFVSYANLLEPGSQVDLVGTCSGTGLCGSLPANLSGEASFLFTANGGNPSVNSLGVAVTYSGTSDPIANVGDPSVGVAGVAVFEAY